MSAAHPSAEDTSRAAVRSGCSCSSGCARRAELRLPRAPRCACCARSHSECAARVAHCFLVGRMLTFVLCAPRLDSPPAPPAPPALLALAPPALLALAPPALLAPLVLLAPLAPRAPARRSCASAARPSGRHHRRGRRCSRSRRPRWPLRAPLVQRPPPRSMRGWAEATDCGRSGPQPRPRHAGSGVERPDPELIARVMNPLQPGRTRSFFSLLASLQYHIHASSHVQG